MFDKISGTRTLKSNYFPSLKSFVEPCCEQDYRSASRGQSGITIGAPMHTQLS